MKREIIFYVVFLVAVCLPVIAAGTGQNGEGTALTIYNENFGVVRQSRRIDFKQGVNKVKFTDVASAIDPTSVNFKCLSAPGAVSVLEQNYEYDLVSADSLLKRYIDKEVTVVLKGAGADTGRQVEGVLLAALGRELILKGQAGGIEILDRGSVENISLKELPEDLVTRPTLIWLAEADETASQLCRVTYTTERIGWKADYSAVLNEADTKIDFSGWVTIDNKSGATYKDSVIKLIAGDVRRIVKRPITRRERLFAMEKDAGRPAFEEKAFAEYHLYTLTRKSTINNNQVKQIEFIEPASGVNVKKLYIYERSTDAEKVQIKLEFENSRKNKLGIPLPKGKVRVFKRNPEDRMLEFIGEDEIDHTAKNQKLLLYIGNAFDVIPEYTLVDSKSSRRRLWQKHKIEISNRKDRSVVVFVDEKFSSNVNWDIDETTRKYEKRDANTARFKVKISSDSTAEIIYAVTQTW